MLKLRQVGKKDFPMNSIKLTSLQLIDFVKHEYQTQTVYPPGKEIFRAFDCCDFDDVKVVIIGQDPYHGAGQANGLCFSVRDGIRMPPSLVNIFKELHKDIGKPIPKSGDLERWATTRSFIT